MRYHAEVHTKRTLFLSQAWTYQREIVVQSFLDLNKERLYLPENNFIYQGTTLFIFYSKPYTLKIFAWGDWSRSCAIIMPYGERRQTCRVRSPASSNFS